jgi:PAS domain S-box-containing protein
MMARLEDPMRLHTATGLNRWVKSSGPKTLHAGRFNIGPRLVLGFVLIILSMLAADALILWQFHLVRTQAERLNGIDQKLVAVLRLHTSLTTFHDRLEYLADSQDIGRLVTEGESLRTAVLEDSRGAMSAFSLVPFDFQRDPTIVPLIHAVQIALPAQLEAITTLANSGDWRAVRQRLANQVTAMESVTLTLVERVDHEVGEEQAQTVRKIKRVQRLVFLVVPATAVFTLLIAGTLGLAITHSITIPLVQLVEGSKALARGDFQHEVPVSGRDELSDLGRVFNDTARRLKGLYAALQQSEDRLRLVIDTIPAYAWRARPDGFVDFINLRFLEFTGRSMEDMLGWGWGSSVHPDDRARYTTDWQAAVATGEPMESEARVQRMDGDYRWLLIRNVPLRDELGNVVNWYGTAIDIEERHRAEDALRLSEAYLAEAQRLSQTGSFGWNPSNGEIIWSEETFRIFQYDRTTTPSLELILQRVHPEDAALVQKTIERAMQDEKDFDHEYRLMMPDASLKHLHVVARTLNNESGTMEFIGAVMDVTERKQAEETLRRSEGYLAEAQRLSHTGSWASKPASGENTYWSEECYRLMGFDPDGGLPGFETVLQHFHPDDQAKVAEAVETAEREKTGFELDYRIIHPGGEIRDIHVIGHPVLSPCGDFVEFVGTVMDITERKRAEDRTRLIIDTVPAQLWTETPQGVVDFVNRRWIDYTGMTLEQAVGSGWNRMVHPDDIERVLTNWRILVLEGKPREIESRLRKSDGTYRWFLSRCYPLIDRSGNVLGWYGSDTDIHDRKEVEETLRRSEGYLAEAQRFSHTGSWAATIGELRYLSEECYRVLGFDPQRDQPQYDVFFQRIHPDDQAKFREAIETAERNKADFELDYRFDHPSGGLRDIHVIGHPVLNAAGDFVEFVGTVIDITERKRAEEERERLRQVQADLVRVNRVTTMGELTASLAHEINQPIAAAVTGANACVRWLAGTPPNLDKARAAAARIVKDGTRAAEIINGIRHLFQKGSLQLELVDANEVIEEMISLLRGEATRYSISVRTELAADRPQVIGDRVQLQQVVMNLMTNSIDAMKSADGTRELAIKSQRADNEQLLITVSDTGVGLPPGQADQIFNAFFTTKPHGTGMGLRICRSIVESHGGHLWATDNSPRGASFFASLPIKVEEEE